MQLKDCTFLIKTFLRPDCLARLLLSIQRFYAKTPSIVVDDSGNSEAARVCAPYSWIRLIATEQKDVGISAGRNIGLREVDTKYFVLLDDDFVFWIMSDVQFMKGRLEETGADIVCGPVCDLDTGIIRHSAMEFLELDDRIVLVQSDLPLGQEGWVDASNNFFIGRTALRERVLWPESIKTEEHGPFFWLLKQAGGKVWTSPQSSVGHLSTHSKEYGQYRYRLARGTDRAVIEACSRFRDEHRLSWRIIELQAEFGDECQGKQLGWRRLLTASCYTQAKFLNSTKELSTGINLNR